jgi:hypothetical protein
LSRSNRRKGEGEKGRRQEAGILDAVGGVDFSLSLFLLFDLGSGCR